MTNKQSKQFPHIGKRPVAASSGGLLWISKRVENFSRRSASSCLCLFLCLCVPLPLHLPQQLFTNLKYTSLPLFLHPQQCVYLYIASFFTVLIFFGWWVRVSLDTVFSVFVLYPACLRVPQGMYILFFIVFLFADFEKTASFPFISLFLAVCMLLLLLFLSF